MWRTQTTFRDRAEAGRRLGDRMHHLESADPVVLGLPRGGVVVAAAVAEALGAPLDVLVVRKIGAPNQPELALGAVTNGEAPQRTLNDELIGLTGVSEDYLEAETQRQLIEVRRRNEMYRHGRSGVEVAGRTVIVVDDGVATGATVQAGLMGLRGRLRGPKRLVLAVPVAAPDSLDRLRAHVDEVVCLSTPEDFRAVGMFYEHFAQTTDEEVIALLDRHAGGKVEN